MLVPLLIRRGVKLAADTGLSVTGPTSSTDLTAATCVEFERARIKLDVRILVTVKRFIVFTFKIERFHNPKYDVLIRIND